MALTSYQTPPSDDSGYRGSWPEPGLTVRRRVEWFMVGFVTAAALIVSLWVAAQLVVWVAGLASPAAWAGAVLLVGGGWGVLEARR